MEKDTGNTRVTLVGIIVEDKEAAGRINGLLHEYGEYIIGRMGIPYHEKQMSDHQCGHGCPTGKGQRSVREVGNDPGSQFQMPLCPGYAENPEIKVLSIPLTYAIISK